MAPLGPEAALIPSPGRVVPLAGRGPDVARGFRVESADLVLAPLGTGFLQQLAQDGLSAGSGPADAVSLVLALDPTAAVGLPEPIGIPPIAGPAPSERYELNWDERGVRISAPAPVGVHRGLTTLRQLVALPPPQALQVVDGPRFAWRGLSVDVARTFFDVTTIKRVVDILDLYKLNVLHLHLSDDQGWRIEVDTLPRLTEIGGSGAFGDRPGGFYTTRQFEDLVAYAAERFITVVPEVEMPGHAAAALRAYPALALHREGTAAANLFDPDADGVWDFVATVSRSIADWSPSPFLHLGGDESFGMPPAVYDRFVREARAVVRSVGKIPITWQDAADSAEPGDLLQHWIAFEAMSWAKDAPPAPDRPNSLAGVDLSQTISKLLPDAAPDLLAAVAGLDLAGGLDLGRMIGLLFPGADDQLRRAVERGVQVILSPAAHMYLDRPYEEESIDPSQRALRDRLGLAIYPPATVESMSGWMPPERLFGCSGSVAGVEAAIWAESIETPEQLEFMLLPRLVGVGERAWSPSTGGWEGYRHKLGRHRRLWEARGWSYFASVAVPWV